jgi:hypothetical protein
MNHIRSGGMRRRGFVRCGALLLWPCAAPAQPPATTLPLSQAINRSGKMRALSQRLSKAYVQGSLGVLAERARDIQAASRQLMSSILAELGSAPLAAPTRPLLQALEKDCQGLLEIVAVPRKDLLEVARSADVVLESADRRAQLAAARSEITQGLAGLQAAPISTPAIRNELELARSQWLFYEAALAKAASPDALQTVATTSERVYEVMDNLTSLYDSALRDLLG